MSKQKSIPVVNPEEEALEVHVKEVMGPAQHFDGAKPTPAEVDEMEAAGLITQHEDDKITVRVRTSSTSVQSREEARVDTTDVTEADDPPIVTEVDTEQSDEQKLNRELEVAIEAGIEELDAATLGESDVVEAEKVASEVWGQPQPTRTIPVHDVSGAAPVVMRETFVQKFLQSLRSWWGTPWKRYGALLIFFALCIVLLAVPRLRAITLNTFGYRSGVILRTIDASNTMPLSGVTVRVGNISGRSDSEGKLRLRGVPLGTQRYTIETPAYASIDKKIDVGVRVADLGDVEMKLTGQRYTYVFKDYVTGRPLAGVVLRGPDTQAVSDTSGTVSLALIPPDDEPTSLQVNAQGYRKETIILPPNALKPIELSLVKNVKEVYVSNQAGRYDVYKVDLDGKNNEMLLESTGLERPGIQLQMSPDGKKVAIVSSRDDKRNTEGYLLDTLTIVDVASGDATVIEHAEAITIVGWRKQAIVFRQTVAGTSAASPARQKIMLYDTAADKRIELASANVIVGQWLGNAKFFYAASGTGQEKTDGFMQVGFDGTLRKQISSEDIWALQRTSFDTYKLKTATNWLACNVDCPSVGVTTPPTAAPARYTDSPSGARTARLDSSTSKPVLTIMEKSGREKVLVVDRTILSAVRWVSEDSIILKTANGANTTEEYIVSINGAKPKKIVDTTP